jgi:hypothetical protein
MAGQPSYTTFPTKSNHPSLDTYGSPEAPVIQTDEETFYLPNDNSYPNALHVITAFPGVTNDTPDEDMNIDNDPDIQLDNYGSPLAPAIQDLSQITFINIKPTNIDTDQVTKLISAVITPNDNYINTNSVPADQNIAQEPSSDFPDQNNPEKYINNDKETLDKVINTPVFYKDTQQ